MRRKTHGAEGLPALMPAFAARRRAVIRSVIMAHGDMRYLWAVRKGAHALREAKWSAALPRFDRALELYPLGPGYLVARGYTYRKLERFEAAEADFRDALALGAPREDLPEHIAYCAGQTGWNRAPYPASVMWSLEPAPVNLFQVGHVAFHLGLITHADTRAVLQAFFGSVETETPLHWQRRFPTLDLLMAGILRDPRFERANPDIATFGNAA